MSLEDYILQHSDREPAYLTKISRDTYVKLLNPRMVPVICKAEFWPCCAK
jgi:hypothetical protein